jgi:hypothetical protein
MTIKQIMKKWFKSKRSASSKLMDSLGIPDEAIQSMTGVMEAVNGKNEHYVILAFISHLGVLLGNVKDEKHKKAYMSSLLQSLERNGLIDKFEIEKASEPESSPELH